MKNNSIQNFNRFSNFFDAQLLFLFLIICFVLSGCATQITKKPFTTFSDSSESLRSGTDNAMKILIPQNIARYKRELNDGLPEEFLTDLRLQLKADDNSNASYFQFESVPSYMKYDLFRSSVNSLMNSMHQYTLLLSNFASEDIQSEEEFIKFSKDLNANVFEAISSVNKSAGNNTAKNVGLISPLAAALFNNYLKNQQKEILLNAIVANQEIVQEFSDRVKDAIKLITVASNQEYLIYSGTLQNQIKDPKTRLAAIDALVKLNQEFFTQIQALNLLYESVGKFPAAHKELTLAIRNPDLSLINMIELVNRANQLKSMVQNSIKTNQKQLLEDDSAKIEAKALAFETDAKVSALDAANAHADAVIARIEAKADPDDADKEAAAKELEKRALILKAIADEKAKTAKAIRDAADAVKNSSKLLSS